MESSQVTPITSPYLPFVDSVTEKYEVSESSLDIDDGQAVTRLLQLADQWRDSSHRQPIKGIGTGTWREPSTFTYQSHEQLTSWLKSFARNYTNITRLYSVGKSVLGQDLWVMEISDNPGLHEPGKHTIALTSSLYSYKESLRIMDCLDFNSGTLLDAQELLLVPT